MMTKPSDNTNQMSSEHTIARITLNSTKQAHITIKSPLIPVVIGRRIADSEATRGDCVHPINTKAIAVVAGIPPIRPPIFGPHFSARMVDPVIQRPPTTKARSTFKAKMESIIDSHLSSRRCHRVPPILRQLTCSMIAIVPRTPLLLLDGEASHDLIILFLRLSQREPRVDLQRLPTFMTRVGLDQGIINALLFEPREQEMPPLVR